EGDEAEEGADEGGLAGAIGAEQPDGPVADLDGQLPQSGDGAVGLGDAAQSEQHGPSPCERTDARLYSICSPMAGGDLESGGVKGSRHPRGRQSVRLSPSSGKESSRHAPRAVAFVRTARSACLLL